MDSRPAPTTCGSRAAATDPPRGLWVENPRRCPPGAVVDECFTCNELHALAFDSATISSGPACGAKPDVDGPHTVRLIPEAARVDLGVEGQVRTELKYAPRAGAAGSFRVVPVLGSPTQALARLCSQGLERRCLTLRASCVKAPVPIPPAQAQAAAVHVEDVPPAFVPAPLTRPERRD